MVACRPSQREKSQSAKPRMTAVTAVAITAVPGSMNGKLTAAPTRPATMAQTTIPRGPLQRGESNRATRRSAASASSIALFIRVIGSSSPGGGELARGLDLGASHATARQERPGLDVECRDPLGPGGGLALERFELFAGGLLAGFEHGVNVPESVGVFGAAAFLGGLEALGGLGLAIVAAAIVAELLGVVLPFDRPGVGLVGLVDTAEFALAGRGVRLARPVRLALGPLNGHLVSGGQFGLGGDPRGWRR